MEKKNVVIIGAGPAGLTAAYELLTQSDEYNVTILESAGNVGGLAKTVNHNGNRMDMGSHYVYSADKKIMDWWFQFIPLQGAPAYDDIVLNRTPEMKPGGPDPEKEDTVMLYRDRLSRIFFQQKFFDYPVTLSIGTIKNLGFFTTIKAGFSFLYSSIFKRKEKSLEDFYINCFGKVLYSKFFEVYTEKMWGKHPRDMAPDWGAQRMQGISVIAVLKELFVHTFTTKKKKEEIKANKKKDLFYYPKFGPGQLWNAVADEVCRHGGEIKLNCPVTGLKTNGNTVTNVAYTNNGETLSMDADYVISSMAMKDLILSIDHVPDHIEEIAEGLPYRDFMAVSVLVDKMLLKDSSDIKTLGNIIPDHWVYVQDKCVQFGRIQVYNNWSPYIVKDPENTVWIGLEYFCSCEDSIWSLSDEACKKMAVDEMIRLGIISKDAKILDYHREQATKAYPSYFGTYDSINEAIDYLNTFDNLFTIGRNGQHQYKSTEHSCATAFEAVRCIINGIKDKSSLWNINVGTLQESKSFRTDA